MYLVCMHPDNAYNTYELIQVQRLEKEMNALFDIRREKAKTIVLTDAPPIDDA